jgi:hypothetical protein
MKDKVKYMTHSVKKPRDNRHKCSNEEAGNVGIDVTLGGVQGSPV